jgi:ribosomal protein L24E
LGHWKKIDTQWHETSVINCELCGQMVPRDVWIATVEGDGKTFCNPECERVYRDYWLPKYGKKRTTTRNE